jgi:hypothetical protein
VLFGQQGDNLHFWLSHSQSHPRHCRLFPSRGTDRAGVDQQRVFHLLDMRPMRVTEDDNICCGIEPCQAVGDAPVKVAVTHQPQSLDDNLQAFEIEAKQTRSVAMGEHDAPSGEQQFDHGRQGRATVGEVLEVYVASHGVHWPDGP